MSRNSSKSSRTNDARKAALAGRTRSSAPAQEAVLGTPTPFSAGALYAVGLALAGAALIAFLWIGWFTLTGGDLRDFAGGEKWGDNLVTLPMLILMVASAPLFLAEYTRRGQWRSRDRGFLEGGSNVVQLRPLATWARLLWIALAIAFWVALILVPVTLSIGEDAFADASENLWGLLFTYGLFASGMAAVMLFSLIKRLTYDGLAARHAPAIVHGSASQLFWRFVSYRFRFELWFAFLSGLVLGALPLVYLSAMDDCYTQSCVPVPDPALLALVVVGAAGFAALALIGCLNAWRSGKSLYSGESVS